MEGGLGDHFAANRFIPAIKEIYYDKYLGKGCCEWADYFYSIAPTIMFAIFKYY